MFRIAQPGDLPALCGLMKTAFGDEAEFTEMMAARFAGWKNVYVAQREDGAVEAMLCAVPVTLRGKPGAYFYALCTAPESRGKGLMTGLMDYAADALRTAGARFIVTIPAEAGLFAFYEKRGFERAFARRTFTRTIRPNLWANAEFDAVTARSLLQLREKFAPDSVLLTLPSFTEVLRDLYSLGITVVSSPDGYGLFFRHWDTLRFIELFAVGDRAAELLVQAAREKTGATQAQITLGAAQSIFPAEGRPAEYGMIRFLGERFDVSESYMGLMLDETGQA